MIRISDADRIRTITLDRPEALNAFSEAMYRDAAAAFAEAARDPEVAVVLVTGSGRAFTAGTDLVELATRVSGGMEGEGSSFPAMIDELVAFPKPLIAAVNGLALGVGATMLALCDLVFMSTEARIRCPFTALGVAPEAGSSYTFPQLVGRQHATWALLSSEWLSADECARAGIAWKVCEPDDLLDEARRHAEVLASKPIASLVECKRAITAGLREPFAAARAREDAAFQRLLGTAANLEALTAFAERRTPDFAAIDREHPVDLGRHLG